MGVIGPPVVVVLVVGHSAVTAVTAVTAVSAATYQCVGSC
mgnify:FL=1